MSKDTKKSPDPSLGWIKLHRDVIKHWIWQNPDYLKAWICMILEANYSDQKVLIDGEPIECKRGQSVNSLRTWVSLFGNGWTVQKTRTFLKLLKKDSMINIEGLRKTTRITICNYDKYQSQQHGDNTEITRRQHAANTQLTTNKKAEKVDKEKKGENNTAPQNFEIEKFKEKNLNKDFITKASIIFSIPDKEFLKRVDWWISSRDVLKFSEYNPGRIQNFIMEDIDADLQKNPYKPFIIGQM